MITPDVVAVLMAGRSIRLPLYSLGWTYHNSNFERNSVLGYTHIQRIVGRVVWYVVVSARRRCIVAETVGRWIS
jgi:hypothetical protein